MSQLVERRADKQSYSTFTKESNFNNYKYFCGIIFPSLNPAKIFQFNS